VSSGFPWYLVYRKPHVHGINLAKLKWDFSRISWLRLLWKWLPGRLPGPRWGHDGSNYQGTMEETPVYPPVVPNMAGRKMPHFM